MREFQGR